MLTVGMQSRKKTPLHEAASQGHSKTVMVLLEAGADIKARTSTVCALLLPLATCQHGELRCFQRLVASGLLSAVAQSCPEFHDQGSQALCIELDMPGMQPGCAQLA